MSGGTPNAGELVLAQLRASLDGSRYSLTAVYAAIIVAFGGAVAVTLGVLAVWHHLREIYAPKPLLAARLEEYESKSGCSVPEPRLRDCLRAVWQNSEQSMVHEHGLDAVIYLRALRMMRNIFALLTLLLFFVAAPINVVFNLHSSLVSNLTKRDALLLLTPSMLSSTQLIPHVVLGWVTNACVLSVLWYNYRRVVRIREAFFADPEFTRKLSNRTLMATDIPRSLRSAEGITRLMEHANPRAAPGAVKISKKLPPQAAALFEEHRQTVRQLEHELILRPGSSRAVSLRADLQRIGQEIDAIRIKMSSEPRPGFQASGARAESYAFASYALHKEAEATAKRGKRHSLDAGASVRLAPPPEQIVWKNLRLGAAERGTKQVVANVLYGVLVVVWIVPSAFIGCFLSNLSRLGSVWPAFGAAMKRHPVGFAILQGVLAPIITTAVFTVLPFIFRRFSNFQGKVTRVDREREVLRKLYIFFFFDNYFVFTMMGVVWDVIAQVLQQTQVAKQAHQTLTFREVWDSLRVASRIATAIVNISSFWVMYLLRAIFALFGSSAQPISLCRRLGRWLNFTKQQTPREKAESDMPQPVQYATGYLSILFNVTVALGFTTIQPLVLPVTLVLFLLAVPLKKFEILHMQTTKYESNGMFWPLVCDIAMFALAFGNLMLLCVIWVQGGWKVAVGASPLAATVVAFKIYVAVNFEGRFYYPDTAELPVDSKTQALDDEPLLSELYVDPAITAELEYPLLTYKDALRHYASLQAGHRTHKHADSRSDANSEASSQRSKSTGENPFGFRHISVGAVRVGSSPYSPIEPYPVYGYDEKGSDVLEQRSKSSETQEYEGSDGEALMDNLQEYEAHDAFSDTFGLADPGEYLLKH